VLQWTGEKTISIGGEMREGEKSMMLGAVGARTQRGSQEGERDRPVYLTLLWLATCKFLKVYLAVF